MNENLYNCYVEGESDDDLVIPPTKPPSMLETMKAGCGCLMFVVFGLIAVSFAVSLFRLH